MSKLIPLPPKITQNGVNRPSQFRRDGSEKLTFKVWRIADEISAKHAEDAKALSKKLKKKVVALPATRREVFQNCLAAGLPNHLINNQYFLWRKFYGIPPEGRNPATPFAKPKPKAVKKAAVKKKPVANPAPKKKAAPVATNGDLPAQVVAANE